MKISEFNTVIYDDKEIEFSKFIRMFKDDSFDSRWIKYDHINNQFKVHIDDAESVLSLPKNVDKNVVDKLMQVVNRYNVYLAKVRVSREVVETGAIPASKTDRLYYEEYLKDALGDAKIKMTADGFLAAVPLVFAGSAVGCFLSVVNSNEPSVLSVFGLFSSLAGIVFTGFGFPFGVKEDYEKYKLLKNKIKALKEYEKKIKKEEKSFKSFVKEVDEKDNNKVVTIKDKFLREASEIALLINGLPKEKQIQYKEAFVLVLTEYQDRVNALLEKNKNEIVLDESRDVWQITVELIPKLHAIESAVREELATLEEKDIFNTEVESVKDLLQGGYTEATYKKVA